MPTRIENLAESMSLIYKAIAVSPIDTRLQREAFLKVGSDRVLQDILVKSDYQPPEADSAREISFYVMSLLTPLMQKADVSEADGKNLCRQIYKSLGGTQVVDWE